MIIPIVSLARIERALISHLLRRVSIKKLNKKSPLPPIAGFYPQLILTLSNSTMQASRLKEDFQPGRALELF